MAGFLDGVLPYLMSRSNAAKREVRGFLDDPLGVITREVNNVNDRARGFLDDTYAATSEGMKYGPATQKLAGLLADSYNPVGMTYPQKEAMETARKNAVKMLGLPENNTAAQRAKALGFTDDVYHGTTADVPAFDLKYYGSDGVAYSTPAVFSSTDARLASDYAKNKFSRSISDRMRDLESYKRANPGVYDEGYESAYQGMKKAFAETRSQGLPETGVGANVMPLMVRGKLRDADAKGAFFMQSLPGELSAAKAAGLDGVRLANVIDHASPASQYPTNVTAVFNPAQMRSRFAAFDPARVNENDLLGRADPLLLGLLGLGAGGAAYLSKD
jgi:hypothetical protein